jgi:hypothetical protein
MSLREESIERYKAWLADPTKPSMHNTKKASFELMTTPGRRFGIVTPLSFTGEQAGHMLPHIVPIYQVVQAFRDEDDQQRVLVVQGTAGDKFFPELILDAFNEDEDDNDHYCVYRDDAPPSKYRFQDQVYGKVFTIDEKYNVPMGDYISTGWSPTHLWTLRKKPFVHKLGQVDLEYDGDVIPYWMKLFPVWKEDEETITFYSYVYDADAFGTLYTGQQSLF